MTKPLLILIAGPYRSGTGDDPDLMAANLAALESAAWPVFRAGHVPMIGEWVALPVLQQRRRHRRDRPARRAGDVPDRRAAAPALRRRAAAARRVHRRRPGRRDRARARHPGLALGRGRARVRRSAPPRLAA